MEPELRRFKVRLSVTQSRQQSPGCSVNGEHFRRDDREIISPFHPVHPAVCSAAA